MLKLMLVSFVGGFFLFALSNCNEQDQPPGNIDFSDHVLPVLKRYCIECHAAGEMEHLDFLAAKTEADAVNLRLVFEKVAETLADGQMPPKKFDQPSDEELTLVVDWIENALHENDSGKSNTPDTGDQTAESVRDRYEKLLVAPKKWHSEMLPVPPPFAPELSLVGTEHLRMSPEAYTTESDWFCSYLFAVDLEEPMEIDEEVIGEQLLLYYRGLGAAFSKTEAAIETDNFSIKQSTTEGGGGEDEYLYTLKWQEPFVNATHQNLNIRVKLISGKNQHGVLFVCVSPQPYGSDVWEELLTIRTKFERSSLPSEQSTSPRGAGKTDDYGAGDIVTGGLVDKSGQLWFCTTDEGVFRYDGKSFVNFSEEDGLNSNQVSCIAEDRDGNLWFGTENGLCYFDGKNFNDVPIPQTDHSSPWYDGKYPIINPNRVQCLLQDRRNFLVGYGLRWGISLRRQDVHQRIVG